MGELGVVSQNTHRFGATPSLDPAGRTPAAPSTPQGGRGMPTPATSGRLEARTTVPSTTAAPRNGRPASSRRRPAPSSGRHRRRSRGGGRRAAAWTLSPRQPTVGLGEEDSDEKRGRTVSYSCPLVSRVALNDHESAGQSTVYRVEVAGIEPASSGAAAGLLRAQPTRDCRGRHHCRRLCRPVTNGCVLRPQSV